MATRSRRNLSVSPREICWVPARLAGRSKDERTTADGPARSRRIAYYRKAGVMLAERAGSSLGRQGKAIPVEEMAVQLSLPIATAENPKGATRTKTRDRLGVLRAGAPKAIGNAGTAAPATMEAPAHRRPRPAATGAMGMIRGREPAGGGGHNPPSRGAVYEQRTYGSVGAGAGNRPGYPTVAKAERVARVPEWRWPRRARAAPPQRRCSTVCRSGDDRQLLLGGPLGGEHRGRLHPER